MKPPKPFSLKDRIDEVKTAERFEVGTGDVRAAIKELQRQSGDVTISVTKRKEELTVYLRHVYDEMAKNWNFVDMVHMLATFHTEIIARGIANPEKFAKEATRVSSDVARIVYPKETASIKHRLPPGESKEVILERLVARLKEGSLSSASPPLQISDVSEATAPEPPKGKE